MSLADALIAIGGFFVKRVRPCTQAETPTSNSQLPTPKRLGTGAWELGLQTRLNQTDRQDLGNDQLYEQY